MKLFQTLLAFLLICLLAYNLWYIVTYDSFWNIERLYCLGILTAPLICWCAVIWYLGDSFLNSALIHCVFIGIFPIISAKLSPRPTDDVFFESIDTRTQIENAMNAGLQTYGIEYNSTFSSITANLSTVYANPCPAKDTTPLITLLRYNMFLDSLVHKCTVALETAWIIEHPLSPSFWHFQTSVTIDSVCAMGAHSLDFSYENCVYVQLLWTSISAVFYAVVSQSQANIDEPRGEVIEYLDDDETYEKDRSWAQIGEAISYGLQSGSIEYNFTDFSNVCLNPSAKGTTASIAVYWYDTLLNDKKFRVHVRLDEVENATAMAIILRPMDISLTQTLTL